LTTQDWYPFWFINSSFQDLKKMLVGTHGYSLRTSSWVSEGHKSQILSYKYYYYYYYYYLLFSFCPSSLPLPIKFKKKLDQITKLNMKFAEFCYDLHLMQQTITIWFAYLKICIQNHIEYQTFIFIYLFLTLVKILKNNLTLTMTLNSK
jgi:hypothetical protein